MAAGETLRKSQKFHVILGVEILWKRTVILRSNISVHLDITS